MRTHEKVVCATDVATFVCCLTGGQSVTLFRLMMGIFMSLNARSRDNYTLNEVVPLRAFFEQVLGKLSPFKAKSFNDSRAGMHGLNTLTTM